MDNTLVGAKAPLATPELVVWFKRVKEIGFQLIIVSNNQLERVSKFATPLDIQYVHEARKPSNTPFRKAMKMMELTPEKTVVVGDQMLTDVYGGIGWVCIRCWLCLSPSTMRDGLRAWSIAGWSGSH